MQPGVEEAVVRGQSRSKNAVELWSRDCVSLIKAAFVSNHDNHCEGVLFHIDDWWDLLRGRQQSVMGDL